MRPSLLPLRIVGPGLGALCLFSLAGCIGPNAFWSPNGKAIALDFDGKLRLFNVASGRFATVDAGDRAVVNPTFSPDGARIAYYAITAESDNRNERADFCVRDLTTNREREVAHTVASSAARAGE